MNTPTNPAVASLNLAINRELRDRHNWPNSEDPITPEQFREATKAALLSFYGDCEDFDITTGPEEGRVNIVAKTADGAAAVEWLRARLAAAGVVADAPPPPHTPLAPPHNTPL